MADTEELKALKSFARAVDKAMVTALGSRPGNGFGERISCIQADEMDEPEKVRPIQRARDRLVELGILKPVF